MKVLKSTLASLMLTTLLLASGVAFADEPDSAEGRESVSTVRATPAGSTPSAGKSSASSNPTENQGTADTERPCVTTHASESLRTVTIGNATYKDDDYWDLDYKGADAVNKTHSSFLGSAEGKVLSSKDFLKFLAIFGKDTVIDVSSFRGRQPVTIEYSFGSTCAYSSVKEGEAPGKSGSWTHTYNFTVEFSSVAPTSDAPSTQSSSSAGNAETLPFPIPTATADSALRNAPALAPIANDAENDEEADEADNESDVVEEEETEAPKLPVTGIQKTTGGGTKDAANATLATDNAIMGASSRAGLLALIACAAFAFVAAVSVFTMRNFRR